MSKAHILRLHKWCGLSACILILVQAGTGAINAFRHDVAQLLDPAGMVRQSQGADAPVNEVLDSLRRSFPDMELERIVFPPSPGGTYFTHLLSADQTTQYASVDPGSTEILRSGGIWAFPSEAAAGIHYNYLVGLPGIVVVMITGILCLAMAVTGLIYWWSLPGARLNTLAINWQARGAFLLRQLHRSVGVVMSLLISFSLVTGVVLAASYVVDGWGTATTTRTGLPLAADPDMDHLIDLAQEEYPDHVIRDVRMSATERVNVFFYAPETSSRAVHKVSVDSQDAAVVQTMDANSDASLWVSWLPLHSGESFGSLGLLLIVVNALALLLLALSGPVMWLNRVRLRRRKAR